MAKIWGRLARTQRAVTAIWRRWRFAPFRTRVQRLCGPRGRSFHDLSVGENAREGMGIRPQGGSNRGPPRAGEDMDRYKGSLGLPLVSTFRAADHAHNCQRRVE